MFVMCVHHTHTDNKYCTKSVHDICTCTYTMSSLIGIYKKLANICIFINRKGREGVISVQFFSIHICIYVWRVVFLAPPVVTLLDLREQLCVFAHGT